MTVYLDVVLLENLCMNYIILFATGYIMKLKMNQIRIIISSLIGGIYAVVSYMEILPIYSNLLVKILLSVMMTYIAYKPSNIKVAFKQLVIFYLTSFAFGGCAFALLYFIKPQDILMRNGVYIGTYPIKIALLGGIVGFIIINLAFYFIKSKISKKDMIYDICVSIKEKQLKTKAMLDTGNLLKDPLTGMPVVVIEKEILYDIVPKKVLDNIHKIIGGDTESIFQEENEKEYLAKFRIIPFHSVGKQNGLMLGLKADYLIVTKDETKQTVPNVIIGIFEQKFTNNNQYSALIGLDILERSEKNESTADIKI